MKKILLLVVAATLAGCQTLPPVKCSATARIGGQDVKVPIYGVKSVASQTKYYAGNPFGWKWVSKSNFTQSTCDK
ncbi:cor protein [Pantoea agglomerans]|uniref:phage exclusion lipoprotein Cor n=1 Tax=Enterobacter agglomerans TaxID=549 RepID=UPI001F211E00|nr:cor protein [Pantoea agglomerans]UIL51506.1 cor protein [Pantoea agglomerans]